MVKTVIATGFVYGKNWGGGYSAYPSREIEAKSRAEVLKKAKAELKSGGLDSGMGFESLKGALLIITVVNVVVSKGKEYHREEVDTEVIGDLTEQEQDFLQDCRF
jgi:hypothetical protein